MRIDKGTLTVVLVILCGVAILPFVFGLVGDSQVEVIGPGGSSEPGKDHPPGALPSLRPPGATVIPAGVPVGCVVGWLKSQTNTPALPREWVECNGQTLNLPGSPYDGLAVPDLNGALESPPRFLRGGTRSGGTGGSEHHRHGSLLLNRSAPRTVNASAWSHAEHLPPFYEVVWIMKAIQDP